jgi:hypothetical protein
MRRPLTLVLGAVPWEVKPLQLELQDPEQGHLFGFPFLRGRIGQRAGTGCYHRRWQDECSDDQHPIRQSIEATRGRSV